MFPFFVALEFPTLKEVFFSFFFLFEGLYLF